MIKKREVPAPRQLQTANTRQANERSECASPVKLASHVVEGAGPFAKRQKVNTSLKNSKHNYYGLW